MPDYDFRNVVIWGQALITDVKDELERLVGVTKKPQKVARAPGMEVR